MKALVSLLSHATFRFTAFWQRTHADLREKNASRIRPLDAGGHDFTVWQNELDLFAHSIFQ